MAFVPKFAARFELPIIENTLAIITRDFKDALDYFYASDNLPDFAERAIGTELGLNFPILVIGPRENPVESTDDDSHLIEDQEIEIKIGVTADSAKGAYIKIMKYVRVLDSVLRTASKDDYCVGMGTGDSAPFGFILNIRHYYGPLGADENRTIYFKPATLELSLQFRER